MELNLNKEELQRLSGEILSLLRLTGVSVDALSSDERVIRKESVSNMDTDVIKPFLHELDFPSRQGYDFLSLARGDKGQTRFLQGEDRAKIAFNEGAENALAFSAPEVEGTDVLRRTRDMEKASDYFRKDSRRYDAQLEKY